MGGLSGAVLPPVFEACLNRYGHKGTLIGWTIAVFILTAFGLFFATSRVPDDHPPKPKWSDFDFLRKPLFWVLLTANVSQGLPHYMPSLYLPSYAIDMGLSSAQGSLLVSPDQPCPSNRATSAGIAGVSEAKSYQVTH